MLPWPPRLNSKEAAKYLGVSDSWMRKKRVSGDGPPFLRLVGKIVYDRETLDRWMEAQQKTNTLKIAR